MLFESFTRCQLIKSSKAMKKSLRAFFMRRTSFFFAFNQQTLRWFAG